MRNIPNLNYNNIQIKLVTRHKFLGMTLDAPFLTWKHHIADLKSTCTKRLSIMRYLSGSNWGASREIQIKFYIAYIRSKIDYGSQIYSSASLTLLSTIDVIQNSALRIATGAIKSSPVVALHAEANVIPLRYRRHWNLIKLYTRCRELPPTHPTSQLLQNHQRDIQSINWISFPHKMPFTLRAHRSFTALSLSIPKEHDNLSIATIPPIPPWQSSQHCVNIKFSTWTKGTDPTVGRTLFTELVNTHYRDHIQIFTDGSHFSDPPRTGSAFVTRCPRLQFSYRLDHTHSSLSAELFAIFQALKWINSDTNPNKKDVIIFTDSLVSLQLITNYNPKSFRIIIYKIKTLLVNLNIHHKTHFQWIPSHIGISGNDLADAAAKDGCSLSNITCHALSSNDLNSHYRVIAIKKWGADWVLYSSDTHLGLSRPNLGPYSWFRYPVRGIDVALTRLRLGHTRFRASMYKRNQSNSPLCIGCQQEDTVKHFLLTCPRHFSDRVTLRTTLRALNIKEFNVSSILSGGEKDTIRKTRYKAYKALASFVKSSGRLPEI